jgi:adenylate cyclase
MADRDFAEWLSEKSWQQGVRFCKVVAVLIPVVAVAVDTPVLQLPEMRSQLLWQMMFAWHVVSTAFAFGVILVDKYARDRWPKEWMANFTAVVVLMLCAWFGAISWRLLGDFSIYALGSVFVAAVLCTPRHIRRPLYLLTATALCVFVVSQKPGDIPAIINVVVNPLCVAIVCLQLDKYAFERNVELFNEKQCAEAERARADKVLYNVFPSSIADELKNNDRVNAVKFDSMGVMFADIVGFTSYSRALPPQALVVVLNDIFSRFDGLVEKASLEKIKTIGDAYMAVSHKNTASLAFLALEMLGDIERYNVENNTEFQLRIGIHVGPTVAGVIGVKRFLYDVWGDTVNVASRMEAAGEPGKVHVTEAVFRQLSEDYEFDARGSLELKGKGTMNTYFLRHRVRLQEPATAAV